VRSLLVSLSLVLSWSIITVPADTIVRVRKPMLRSVRFVDQYHGWIAGYRGVFYTSNGGSTWEKQPVVTGSSSSFGVTSAVRGTGDIVWHDQTSVAVRSDKGLLHHRRGSRIWLRTNIRKAVLEYLHAIAFADAKNGWGVGAVGHLYRTTDGGRTWQRNTSPDLTLWHALSVVSASEVWVVGEGGKILHTSDSGRSWREHVINHGRGDLHFVRFNNRQNGWICGTSGLIFHTTDGGENWEKQAPTRSSSDRLVAMSFSDDEKNGWAVGYRWNKTLTDEEAVILHTQDGGAHWAEQVSPVQDCLIDIQALPAGRAWVVGESGTVLRTSDQGEHWQTIKID
jgi:photosystem II stability/assembly factor-like uncharacterized protein